MSIICERCVKHNCECVPYDVECDENFEEKESVDSKEEYNFEVGM